MRQTIDSLHTLIDVLEKRERGEAVTCYIPDQALQEILQALDPYAIESLVEYLLRPELTTVVLPHIDSTGLQQTRHVLSALSHIKDNVVRRSREEPIGLLEISQTVLARILHCFSALTLETLKGMLEPSPSRFLQQYTTHSVLYAAAGLTPGLVSLKEMDGAATVAKPNCTPRSHP
jgi:hypothetical protein